MLTKYTQNDTRQRIYIRDGRSPIPKNETTSKVMSANKAKNTKPEFLLRKAIFKQGIRGYRLNLRDIPGRPDIAFLKKKKAIFVHGCFWHRCPYCNLPLPNSNTDFWKKKFKNNVDRDKRTVQKLEAAGWEVLVIWECQINQYIDKCVKQVQSLFTE